jgi:hypothetical protein
MPINIGGGILIPQGMKSLLRNIAKLGDKFVRFL